LGTALLSNARQRGNRRPSGRALERRETKCEDGALLHQGAGRARETRETVMPKILAFLLALGALSACNTISGAGEDLGAAGSAITNEAEETQSEM
jgi:predicted small secreted protein